MPSHESSVYSPGLTESLTVRPFGETLDDLEVDFKASRPFVITQLIHGCVVDSNGAAIGYDKVWAMTMSRRLQLILRIFINTRTPNLNVTVRCPACNEMLDLKLNLASLQSNDDPVSVCCHPEFDVDLTLRLPTGIDQRGWLADGHKQDASEWCVKAVTSLVELLDGGKPPSDWRAPDAWLPAIAETLEAADPHTTATLNTTCCNCQNAFSVLFDVERHIIENLASLQPGLIDEIHRLASAYHWTEAEIFDVPRSRRRRYLRRIDRSQMK
jgi:hypothetical protein